MRWWLAGGGLVLLGLLSLAGAASGGTTVPGGTLASDTTWDLAGSPYTLDGDIVVPAGVTLTIEAGVDVGWNMTYALIVEGGLVVNGTAAAPVDIYATGIGFFPHWVGIQFAAHTIDSVIRNATLDRATLAVDVQDPVASLLLEDVYVTSVSGYGEHGLWIDGAASNVVVHRFDMRGISEGAVVANSSGLEFADLHVSNLGLSSAYGLVVYNVSQTVVDGLDFSSARVRLERVTDFTLSRCNATTGAGLDTVELLDSSNVSVVASNLEGVSGARLRFDNVSNLSIVALNTLDTGGGSRGPSVWGTDSAGVSIQDVYGAHGAYALRMDGVTGLVARNITSTGLGQGVFVNDCPAFVLDGANLSTGGRPVEIAGDSDGGRVSNASLNSYYADVGFLVEDPFAHPDLDVSRGNTVSGWPVLGIYRQPGVFVANASNYAWIYVFDSPNVTVIGARLAEMPRSSPLAVWVDSPGGRLEDWTVPGVWESDPGVVLSNSPATTIEHVISGARIRALNVDGLRISNSSFVADGSFPGGAALYIWTNAGVEIFNVSTLYGGLHVQADDVRVTSSKFCSPRGLLLNNVSRALISNLSFCPPSSPQYYPNIVLRGTSAVIVENTTFNGTRLAVDVNGSGSATFRWNTFTNCTGTGLQVAADAGSGTEVYENLFACGPLSASDSSGAAVTWYNATTHRGNYWDDFTGVDADGDGIGDTPYPIPGGSKEDLYPLMTPLDRVPPVAVPFAPSTVDEDVSFPLDGSNSTDNLGFLRGWWIIEMPSGPLNVSGLVTPFIFNTPGVYNVTLFVTDGWSRSSATTSVTVNDVTPPVVTSSTITPTPGKDNEFSVEMIATDNDPAFPLGATYWWSLSGPESRNWTTPGPSTNFSWTATGTHTFHATVSDAAGNRATSGTASFFYVDPTPPNCTATVTTSPPAGSSGTFTFEMTGEEDNEHTFPNPDSFQWAMWLPNGTRHTGTGTTFTFEADGPGDYEVEYMCIDSWGRRASGTLTVTVPDRDGPLWTPPPLVVVDDGERAFISTADATDFSGVAGAYWFEGGRALSSGFNLNRRWTGLGDHTVDVTLWDTVGNTANFSLVVRVIDGTPPFLADAGFIDPREVQVGDPLVIDTTGGFGAFRDNDPAFPVSALFAWSTNGPVEGWIEGAGNRSVSVVFSEPGNWTVHVTVADAAGNTASFDVPVKVLPELAPPPGGNGGDGGGEVGGPLPLELLLLVAILGGAAAAGLALWRKRRLRQG